MPRTHKPIILPPMPFGQARAQTFGDVREFTDAVSGVVDHQFYFDALGDARQFHHAAAAININGTRLVASVSTPTYYRVGDSQKLYLMIPFQGCATTRVSGYKLDFGEVRDVFLSPNIERSGQSSVLSMIQVMLEAKRLIATSHALFGDPAVPEIKARLEHPNVLAFRQGRIRYDHLFRQIGQRIDDLQCNETLLALQGVDDTLYRTLVMMLLPERCLQDDDKAPVSQPAPIDHVCDYIQAHLTHPITLTQLEAVSGMTSRSLRYGFQKRFGCSPMQWVQAQRLELAYRQLLGAKPTDTVTRVAYAAGITRLGTFARDYFRRFGERPSETLARGLRR